VDRPLKVPRNTFKVRFLRLARTGVALLAIVCGVSMLPIVILYFADKYTEKSGEASAVEIQGATNKVVAFVNVHVVPMDGERVLPAQTVLIKDGLIAEIGPAYSVRVPSDALKIDGRGKYLMPGLADMHVHLQTYNEQDNRAMFKLFLANGVTTILNLYGNQQHLELRRRVANGQITGPTVYTSGPYIANLPDWMPTVEEVERMVVEQKQAGYDIIKIHGDFSREAYRKLFEVARREGMRVIGHAPRNLGIEVMLEERQDALAHAEEYLYAYFYFKANPALKTADLETKKRYIVEQEARIAGIAQATAKAGTWVVPNLTAYRGIGLQAKDVTPLLNRPEMKYVPTNISAYWMPDTNRYVQRFSNEDARWSLWARYELLEKLVKGLSNAGVRLMTGTDTPIPSVIPGFSIHDELRDLVAAGLTPYQAIRAATVSPAEFLGAGDLSGTVTAGKRADLMLVERNPLEDVNNAARRAGVMVRGRWFTESELRKMLDSLSKG
jgi:imidazolonepropionase-like amidohydrolase